MMRRTSFRLSALILATLFFVSTTKEALGLDCAHHDLTAAANLATAEHGGAHSGGYGSTAEPTPARSDYAPEVLHALGDRAELDEDEPTGSAGVCFCIGDCNGTSSVPPPSAITARLQAVATTIARAPGPELEANLPGPIPYLFPPATAPPHES
jgi:hypothetical protein